MKLVCWSMLVLAFVQAPMASAQALEDSVELAFQAPAGGMDPAGLTNAPGSVRVCMSPVTGAEGTVVSFLITDFPAWTDVAVVPPEIAVGSMPGGGCSDHDVFAQIVPLPGAPAFMPHPVATTASMSDLTGARTEGTTSFDVQVAYRPGLDVEVGAIPAPSVKAGATAHVPVTVLATGNGPTLVTFVLVSEPPPGITVVLPGSFTLTPPGAMQHEGEGADHEAAAAERRTADILVRNAGPLSTKAGEHRLLVSVQGVYAPEPTAGAAASGEIEVAFKQAWGVPGPGAVVVAVALLAALLLPRDRAMGRGKK